MQPEKQDTILQKISGILSYDAGGIPGIFEKYSCSSMKDFDKNPFMEYYINIKGAAGKRSAVDV